MHWPRGATGSKQQASSSKQQAWHEGFSRIWYYEEKWNAHLCAAQCEPPKDRGQRGENNPGIARHWGPWTRVFFYLPKDSSFKRQASSPKHKASSDKPQATSSRILDPGKSFTVPGPRASAKINELLGWRTWNAIWCGENLILFPLHTFSSTVKKWPLVLYPNRSGVPDKLRFSSLIHDISGIYFLTFAYNFCSGFKGT